MDSLYKFLIKNEIVFVYEKNECLGGFVSCSLNSDKLMKRFVFYSPVGVFKILLAVISRPYLIIPVWETTLAPYKSDKKRAENITLPKVELLSVSVAPELQYEGIGTKLLYVLEGRLNELGVSEYKVVAGSSLKGANNFYKKNGFKLMSTINIHKDDLSNVYCKFLQ